MSAPRRYQGVSATLLAGHPRSGTTWLTRVLGASCDVVEEPDNERSHPLAVGFKRSHRFPTAASFDESGLAEIFQRARVGDPSSARRRLLQRMVIANSWNLEQWIARQCGSLHATRTPANFSTRDIDPDTGPGQALGWACRRVMPPVQGDAATARPRLIKTVHAIRCLEDVAQITGGRVLVVLRNPYAILASLRRPTSWAATHHLEVNPDVWRNVGDGAPSPRSEAFQVAQLLSDLAAQIERNDHWLVASHDQICRDPEPMIEQLCGELDLPPEPSLAALHKSIQPGEGMSPYRSSLIGQIDRWRDDLDDQSMQDMADALSSFELQPLLERFEATGAR